MEERQHVRVLILHHFERGFTAAQACKEIRANDGRYQISTSNLYYWYKRFRSGNHSVVDEMRPGRPTIYDTKLAAKQMLNNPRMHSRSLAMHVGCSQSTALRLLRKMELVPKKPSVIPHVLSKADKKRRVAICRDLLKKHRRGSFFHRIITCDEKWCLYDNSDQSVQWVNRFEKPNPVQRKNIHGKKSMLTVFWCVDGPILWKLAPQGKSIDADYVCQELGEMVFNAENCGRKRDEILLLWDNCRPHFAKKTQQKLEELQLEVLPQPAYSPDLAPSDYHLFGSLEHWLKGKQLRSEDDLKFELSAFFDSKKRSFFDYGIRSLARRWQTVIDHNDSYIQ